MSDQGEDDNRSQASPNVRVPQFALFPGMILNDQDDFLDFSLSENQKLYKEGCAPLEFKYEGKPEQLLLFKEHLNVRATKMNWWDVIEIPISDNDPNSDLKNVITQHGQLTNDMITNWAQRYIIDEETRAVQDNHMMFTCLTKSILDEVMKKIVPDKEEYIIQRVPIAALYLKLLISKAEMDSRATTSKLVTLHVQIVSVNYDITKFHDHVNSLLTTLNAYGQALDNNNEQSLTISLLGAYHVVPDAEFHNLIGQRRSEYLLSNTDLEPKKLMNYAQNIFDYRNEDQSTPWLQKSKDRLQIEALSAQVQSLHSENKKLNNSNKSGNGKRKTELEKLAAALQLQ